MKTTNCIRPATGEGDTVKFRKKPVVIDAVQWFRNGDYPGDHHPFGDAGESRANRERYDEYVLSTEGMIVRKYRHHSPSGNEFCEKCGKPLNAHGWLDTLEGKGGAQVVCPGDWIITGIKGERYPCKPDVFELTYESAE